jgi:hypothetical protein
METKAFRLQDSTEEHFLTYTTNAFICEHIVDVSDDEYLTHDGRRQAWGIGNLKVDMGPIKKGRMVNFIIDGTKVTFEYNSNPDCDVRGEGEYDLKFVTHIQMDMRVAFIPAN